MNTEEKAKAYDEALDKAKKELQTCGSTDCDAARQIFRFFPELRESEDERIRKALIWHLKADADFVSNGVTKAECIAYLEKQKEQKLYWKPTKTDIALLNKAIITNNTLTPTEREELDIIRSRFGYCRATNCNGIVQKEQKHPNGCFTCDEYKKGYEEGRRNGFTAGYNKAMKEVEQKEQKPVESISQLTVKGKGVYKICPYCKSRMIRDESKIYTSIPPQYGYNCPKCGAMEFDTVIYDNPEMEAHKSDSLIYDKDLDKAAREFYLSGGAYSPFDSTGLVPIVRMAEFGATWMKKKIEEEQKPAEWDDYTKTNLGRAIQIIKDARGNLYGYQTDDGIYECDKAIEALEHFLYRGLEIEKSAEWSEEDDGELQNAIDALEFLGKKGVYKSESGYDAALQAASWLKSFRLQLKLDWSKEDKVYLEDALWCVKQAAKVAKDENGMGACWSAERWLKSLSERFNVPPKQEWNKEDDKMLSRCIKSIESSKQFAASSVYEKDKEINWIKSLKPQPKQDRSEDDERMFEGFMHKLEVCDLLTNKEIAWAKHRLKSLGQQSHWKPSEEQMAAFKGYIEDFQARAEAAVGGWNNFDVMIRLYEQLKHLRD